MKTRSQTKNEQESEPTNIELNVDIDFYEASRAWRSNKVRIGDGYKYVCQKPNMSGSPCKKKCLQGSDYCKTHMKMINKQSKLI